jgi:hypothetical protein
MSPTATRRRSVSMATTLPRNDISRNFRFDSPISTRLIDQTASFGKSLVWFWPTVAPAVPARLSLTSRPRTPRMRFSQSIPETLLPPPYVATKICCAPWTAYPAGTGSVANPPQHAAKEPPRQMTLRQQQPIVVGVLNKRPPVFTSRCCKLVRDQLAAPAGSASRRHRFPGYKRSG